MGYLIRKLINRRRAWKLQFTSETNGIRKTKDIPITEYRSLGFSIEMSINDAQSIKNQLNARDHLERRNKKRINIMERLQTEQITHQSFLNPTRVKEFESKYLFRRFTKKDKIASYWRIAQRIICELQLDISEWADQKDLFYDYFTRNSLSYSYVQKVLGVINKWGRFLSHKHKQYFVPIPGPTGYETQRIHDAYYQKRGLGKQSLPLTPSALYKNKNNLLDKHFNWLLLSIYFGLRPIEVDSLKQKSSKQTWYISNEGGVVVLWVYQSKLRSVAPDKRVKPIPCILTEQNSLLEVIRGGNFKRPLVKTLRLYFGENITTYGGRKGFVDLMLGYGQSIEDISVWMGHQNITRTWQSYKNKQIIHYKKIA